MDELVKQIGENDTRTAVMEKIMQYVPCVLHLENRVALKILTMLLIEGISNAAAGNITSCNEDTIKQREISFLQKSSNLVSKCLGEDVTWEVPVEKKSGSEKQSIGIINMENYRCRKVVDSITDLVELCIPDDERRRKWNDAIFHYNKLMRIMRKKGENYTVDELDAYKFHADEFFQVWVELHGRHGITIYIHIIGSGHMLIYMRRWANLTKYSQQGWEALNALIKLFFF